MGKKYGIERNMVRESIFTLSKLKLPLKDNMKVLAASLVKYFFNTIQKSYKDVPSNRKRATVSLSYKKNKKK